MNINKSEFFKQSDLDLLKLMGVKNPRVETRCEGIEQISLGHGNYLLGSASMGLNYYYVFDEPCRDSYLSERSVMGAIFRYNNEDMRRRPWREHPEFIPDYFRPWEVSALFTKMNDKTGPRIYATRGTDIHANGTVYHFTAIIAPTKMKFAVDPYGDDPFPDVLPPYNKWETALDAKTGKPLEISLGNIFKANSQGWTEKCRALNIAYQKLDFRQIKI